MKKKDGKTPVFFCMLKLIVGIINCMEYGKIVSAIFLSRPNRFIANVIVDGKEESVHVKNTGRCRELLVPGCRVYLEDFLGKMGKRKYRYSLIAVEKQRSSNVLLVNMDSQAPNRAAYEALSEGIIDIPGLGKLSSVRPESVYGNSRFDFYVEDEDGHRGFVEVKGCTLEEDGVASFPDAPTERGVKHIEELIDAKEKGYSSTLLFIVQMQGMKYIRPNDETHRAFGDALRRAAKAGVNVIAYECEVFPDSMTVNRKIPVLLK